MKRIKKKKRDPTTIAARYNREIEMIDRNIDAVLQIFCRQYGSADNKTGWNYNFGKLAIIGHKLGWYWAEVARWYLRKYHKEEWKHLKRANGL